MTVDQAVCVGVRLDDADPPPVYSTADTGRQPLVAGPPASAHDQAHRPQRGHVAPHNLRELIEAGALDIVVIDMTPAGGIAGLRQQVAIADDAGITMVHHCAFDLGARTADIIHAVSGIPEFSLLIDTAYYGWEDIIEEPLTIDGAMPVPDGPGLGVTVDRDAIDRHRVD